MTDSFIKSANFWKDSFDKSLLLEKTYSQSHINYYADTEKNTSKRVASNLLNSYNLTNIINVNEIDNILKEGIPFIYGKNAAFKLLKLALNDGSNYIYMDNGYFSKFYDKKITKFRIIVNDVHPQKKVFEKSVEFYSKNIEMLPWKERSSEDLHILLCPPTTCKYLGLFGIKDNWLELTIKKIRSQTDRKILIRFKNYSFVDCEKERLYNYLNKKFKNIFFGKELSSVNLVDLFSDCYAVVAPASGVAVIAATYGIPVFSEKFGPVASIAQTNYLEINNPIYPNRDIWLNTLLAHEFTLDDIFSGKWLMALKNIYTKELKKIPYAQINLLHT